VIGAELRDHLLAVRQDHREQVVEVVRDPARKSPDRFEPLRVPQLVLAPVQRFLGRVAVGERRASG
jgi:hypothetical protein